MNDTFSGKHTFVTFFMGMTVNVLKMTDLNHKICINLHIDLASFKY